MLIITILACRLWPGKWIITSITVALVLYLTLAPKPLPDDVIPIIPGLDKVIHALMFGAIAAAAILDASHRKPHSFSAASRRLIVITTIATSIFGGIVELLQFHLVNNRSGDIFDFIADFAGIVIFSLIAAAITRRAASGSTQ